MKKFLALILASIVLVGCTPATTEPVMEEDTTTPDVMVEDDTTAVVEETSIVPDTNLDSNSEDIQKVTEELNEENAEKEKARLEEEKAENAQMQKDLDLLSSFNGEPTVSDCNKINHPDVKMACMDVIEE